jgi:hypothetical protein
MSAIGFPAVNARTAHHEWATRPPDERYTSVPALYEAARKRRARTDESVVDSREVRVEAISADSLRLRGPFATPLAMTHWSFGQLASIGGAPAQYLRTLPAPIAAEALNYGLSREKREAHQLYVESGEQRRALALTSQRYARLHHDDLVARVMDLMSDHPEWHLPLGYKNGDWGAERVPSGAYLGDRDLFLILIDGNRDLDDPADRDGGLHRGFILRNSDVGAAALTLDLFLFRRVCANHLIWGFHHLVSLRRRHVGTSMEIACGESLEAITRALDADTASDRNLLHRANTIELGSTTEAVIETASNRAGLPRKQAAEAFELAERHERNPRSVWGFVQGLTMLSQRSGWQDQRFALDRAASRFLDALR